MRLSASRLRELLDYDPHTGQFTWRVSISSRAQAGGHPGSRDAHGYLTIQLDGQSYKAHRLAWLWMTGSWPPDWIDHRNRDRADNSFANLRLSTRSENQQNRPKNKNNKSGFKGVTFYPRIKRKQWRATITANGQSADLGYFLTKREAYAAYRDASQRLHREFSGV